MNLCCQFQDVTLAQIRHAAMAGCNDCGQTARPSDPQMWAMLRNKRWGLPLVHIEEPHPNVGSMVHHQCPSESCHVEVSPCIPRYPPLLPIPGPTLRLNHQPIFQAAAHPQGQDAQGNQQLGGGQNGKQMR